MELKVKVHPFIHGAVTAPSLRHHYEVVRPVNAGGAFKAKILP